MFTIYYFLCSFVYIIVNVLFNFFFGIFFKEDVKYDLKFKNGVLEFFKKLDYFFFFNKFIEFSSLKKDYFKYPLLTSFFFFNNYNSKLNYTLKFKELYNEYLFFSLNLKNLSSFFSKYFYFVKSNSNLLSFIILVRVINLNFLKFSNKNYSYNLNFLILLFLNKKFNNNFNYTNYNFDFTSDLLCFYKNVDTNKLSVSSLFSNKVSLSKRLLVTSNNYKNIINSNSKLNSFSVFNNFFFSKFNNWYLNVNKSFFDNISSKWLVKFSATDVVKYIKGDNIDNYSIYFLRKNKVFNKGRYSRNRQIYRTGVYWCLYINIVAMVGLYFWFYRFTINYGYVWWLLFIFIASFIIPKAVKYRLYNPKNLFNSYISDFKWLGFQLFLFNKFFISILNTVKVYLLNNILVFNLILRKFNFNFVEKFSISLLESFFSFVTYFFYYKNKNFSKKNGWLYIWEYSQINSYNNKLSLQYQILISNFFQFFKMFFSK